MHFASRDYDTGFSGEWGSVDLPGSLSADELEVERWKMLCLNGREKVEAIIRTGSWPV